VVRSGQTQELSNESLAAEARRKQALALAGATQVGDLQAGLLNTIAGQEQRGAELGLSLAGQNYLENGALSLAAQPLAAPTYTFGAPVTPTVSPIKPTTIKPAPVGTGFAGRRAL
ncbi:MAG: hypothetical protein ACRDH5_00080, partial [bacterium]